MPTTNYPNGVTSFGAPVIASRSQGGRIVLHVCNRTGCPAGDGSSKEYPLSTLFGASGALAKMQNRADGGDIFVWPGHNENVDAADKGSNLGTAKNVAIIGIGSIPERPTLTWTAAAATLLLDTAGCSLRNFNLYLDPQAGGVVVAAPLTISGTGCILEDCLIMAGTDALNHVTVGITVTGDYSELRNLDIVGATAAECTTVLRLTSANGVKLHNVRITAATSAIGVGVVQFLTTASTGVEILGCHFRNNKAASTDAVTGMAGISGFMDNTHLAVLSDAAAALTGAFGTPADFVFGRNVGITNLVGERAALFGTESA